MLPFFRRLAPRRPYEGGAPLPIRHEAMEVLARIEGVRLKAWEVEAIEILDAAWLRAVTGTRGSGGA